MPGLRYVLALEFTDLSSDYRGSIAISGDFKGPSVDLDADGLAVQSVEAGGVPLGFALDPSTHRLHVQNVGPTTGAIRVGFSGRIELERPHGLYRSPLGEGSAITTQLEPVGARRVFPCFDRPDAKAVFELEVIAPNEFSVISNMPIEREEPVVDGRRRTRFSASPPMATYLFYLGIGPFEQNDRVVAGHRVIAATARGVSAKTAFALDAVGRSLQYFEQYYGIPYPLPKMHLVGMPKFLSGAMENWGAIVSSEPGILEDEKTSMQSRIAMMTVVAHEVAHQWFGNLVTMRTWDDLWLNEGFATFVSYKARAALFPEWAAWEEFTYFMVGTAMMVDSLPHTHPIHVDVLDPTRAPEYFDDISYGKGAAVLRMLEAYIGEDAFREGVTRYLKEHAMGNAQASDLWKAVALSSRQPVDRVMAEWILRPGFPVIRARMEGSTLVLEQRRFSFTGPLEEAPWPVPLTLEVDGRRVEELMETRTLSVPASEGARVLVGPGRTGFYRVRYESPLRERVLGQYDRLSALDRFGIQNDSVAFLLSGELGLSEYLDILRRVGPDSEAMVVRHAFDALTWLYPLVRRFPRWERAYREVFAAQGDRLGLTVLPGESANTTALRDPVSRARVALDPGFRRELAKYYGRADALAPEVAEAVYMAYAAEAGPDEYASLLRRFREAPPGLEGRRVAGGLASLTRDDWILECLELLRKGEMQLSSWSRMTLSTLWLNPDRAEAYWTFLTTRLEQSLPALQSGSWSLPLTLQYSIPVAGLSRPREMHEWVARQHLEGGEEGAKKGLDMLDVFTRVLDREAKERAS
ncbi:MAG: M1 family metallopeptidase [Thermoplasmata archaeon]